MFGGLVPTARPFEGVVWKGGGKNGMTRDEETPLISPQASLEGESERRDPSLRRALFRMTEKKRPPLVSPRKRRERREDSGGESQSLSPRSARIRTQQAGRYEDKGRVKPRATKADIEVGEVDCEGSLLMFRVTRSHRPPV
jgi:hypothetical protein